MEGRVDMDLAKIDAYEEAIQEKWVNLLTNGGEDGEKACKKLRTAGFYVNMKVDETCRIPIARLNGSVYRGLLQIEKLAENAGLKS